MKDKAASLFALGAVLIYLSCVGYIIWAIIEFILYLVKDNPFNWLPVYLLVGTISCILLFFIIVLIIPTDKRITNRPLRKSAFQTRLEEMQKQREGLK